MLAFAAMVVSCLHSVAATVVIAFDLFARVLVIRSLYAVRGATKYFMLGDTLWARFKSLLTPISLLRARTYDPLVLF